MTGLLDDIGTMIMGSNDPSTADQDGVTQAQRRMLGFNSLGQMGALLLAAGQPMYGPDRARILAQLGNVPAQNMQQRQMMIQNRLMNQKSQEQARELDVQKQQDQTLASPEIAAAMDQLTPQQRLIFKAAPRDQKAAVLEKMLNHQPKVSADGTIVMSDGSVINGLGQMLVGPGGKPVQQGAGPAAPGGAGFVKPDQVFAASKYKDFDMDTLKQIAQQYGVDTAWKVRQYAENRTPFPISMRTAAAANPNTVAGQVMNMVQAVRPGWSSADFTNQNKLWNEFFGSGKTAGNITSLDTTYGHLGNLYDAAKALSNGDVQAQNQAINYIRTQLGHPEATNANMAMLAVGHELAKVFRDQGMSKGEIDSWEKQLQGGKLSPQQIQGGIEMALGLMEGRVDALKTRYVRGGGKADDMNWFTPSHVEKAQDMRANPLGGPRQSVTVQSSAPSKAAIEAELRRRGLIK